MAEVGDTGRRAIEQIASLCILTAAHGAAEDATPPQGTTIEQERDMSEARIIQGGTLPIGIVIDGVRHADFELRPATVGDNVDAQEEYAGASPLRVSAAVYARQFVKFGALPREHITTELVLALSPEDFNALEEAQVLLKKKLIGHGMPWRGGTASAPAASASD